MKLKLMLFAALAAAFSSCDGPVRTFKVKGDSGADIQASIDRASARGGGKVVVPEGEYHVSSILLKSHVDLHLEKGALLIGSEKSDDYDSFPQDVCTINPEKSTKVLLYAFDAEDIALTGEGTIDGSGPSFFEIDPDRPGTYPKPPVERPLMVKFVRCSGVRLEDVTLKDSPCWTVMLRMCENITVNGITITADQKMINNDGIDFDGCRHAYVTNSTFKTCDDCLVLRAIKEYPEQSVICEDIMVDNCDLNSVCQTVRLGCPGDDVIRNATFTNIRAEGHNGIFADFPTRYLSKEGSGCVDISGILFDGYSGVFYGSALQIVSEPGVTTRNVDGLVFRNIDVTSRRPLRFIGNAGHEIGNVVLENVNAVVEEEGDVIEVRGCTGLEFKNVSLNGQTYPDGIVAGEPGSDSVLGDIHSDSWERLK